MNENKNLCLYDENKIKKIMKTLKIEDNKDNFICVSTQVSMLSNDYLVEISTYEDFVIAIENGLTVAFAHDLDMLEHILKNKKYLNNKED